MIFNSMSFLIFFPIVTVVYFLIPHKIKWIWLLVTSYFFYMCWNPQYAILIGFSTVITYLSGIFIEKLRKIPDIKKSKRLMHLVVYLCLAINLGLLFFFKYFDFAIDNINIALSLLNLSLVQPEFDVLLPVGISFYTFQALSYTIDVYRGDIYAERNIGKYALFVSFFPQLVAGPIERSKNLLTQINDKHNFDYTRAKLGLQLMLWGLFQKIVIADRVAIIVNNVYGNYSNQSGIVLILATILFAVQIYCDFSGYSNMAIGAAQVMGFKLMDNFNRPYFARSIKDFWHRWHISLSSWFRDYLYIPLGGSRCSKERKCFNLMVTFLLSGLWHGASWNYVVWGVLHGFYQVSGEILTPVRSKIKKAFKVNESSFAHRLFQCVFTFILVDIAWIFFRAPGVKAGLSIVKTMITNLNLNALIDGTLYTFGVSQSQFTTMLITIVVLFIVSSLQRKYKLREKLQQQPLWFRWMIYFIAINSILYLGVYGSEYAQTQFIYFQF
ncbi:MBOAT family O-acyltransferase [Paludicola sp. MB14-C6]|uniref:MBOAT family O-acyltransferase n=1 Tax=Paludihabitans sp. MB14-C6 TaxID=3070656 RepID=UPI0027DCF315|nr:MBOAT family O-acyltransferase [Paludicola sp. MB14-C6]WMJ22944.1 MBOAT family O-acyltransferase [Paludicola sp. MB14-C6]